MTTAQTAHDVSDAVSRAVPHRAHRAKRSEAWAALLFLSTFLLIYGVFLVYPLFKGVWISLHDWELVGGHRTWIGFLNYEDLWNDRMFWKAGGNTLRFAAMTVPAMTLLAFALALGISGGGRVRAVLRSVFFLSSVFSVSVVTLVWTMVFSADRGLIAPVFETLGAQPINFLGHPDWAMPAIAVTTLWWGVGLPMALFLAALGQIPRELYEAAELDHASRWATLTRITLPAIRHTILLVVVLQLVAQFQLFGQPHLMTKGGPANTTISLVQYIYETAFRDWLVGYGAAIAMALFALMLVFSMLQLWIGRRGDAA